MSNILQEVLAANQRYAAEFGDKAKLAIPPARHFAILTCMDARLDPAKFAGLAEGDAHVIRNAGGRASDDAIRSLDFHIRGHCKGLVFCHLQPDPMLRSGAESREVYEFADSVQRRQLPCLCWAPLRAR